MKDKPYKLKFIARIKNDKLRDSGAKVLCIRNMGLTGRMFPAGAQPCQLAHPRSSCEAKVYNDCTPLFALIASWLLTSDTYLLIDEW